MKKTISLNNIIISRTDSIGDVVLTLPVAAAIKKKFPSIKVAFLGRSYTKPVIEACKFIDQFIDLNDFYKNEITIDGKKPEAILHVLPVKKIAFAAKQKKIPLRIGTTNRIYHWLTCNKLVKLSRKNSELHEAQLNIKLLEGIEIYYQPSLQEIATLTGLEKISVLEKRFSDLLSVEKFNLILHPKSQGSGREWGLENFIALIRLLDNSRFNIFISGTEKEKESLQPLFDAVGNKVKDITGLMDLNQFISFIQHADGLVASGTGPLHIAAALGIHALGIFPPIRPIHPGRWAPIGKNATVFVMDKTCYDCRKNINCTCIQSIKPLEIAAYLHSVDKIKIHKV